jgi:hypothetical protein
MRGAIGGPSAGFAAVDSWAARRRTQNPSIACAEPSRLPMIRDSPFPPTSGGSLHLGPGANTPFYPSYDDYLREGPEDRRASREQIRLPRHARATLKPMRRSLLGSHGFELVDQKCGAGVR